MNRKKHFSRHAFSLIELLIAMAILVLMMSFLLQFTNSARRIYTASSRHAATFEAGNLLFQYLDRDLKNLVFRDRESNPDREIPIYYKEDGDDRYLAFVTTTRCLHNASNDFKDIGAYLVVYRFKEDSKTLERFVLDKKISLNSTTWDPYWFLGVDLTQSTADTQFLNCCKALMEQSDCGDVLVSNVTALDFSFLPNESEGFRDTSIQAVRFSLSVKADPNGDDDEDNRRVFSKLVFLPYPQSI